MSAGSKAEIGLRHLRQAMQMKKATTHTSKLKSCKDCGEEGYNNSYQLQQNVAMRDDKLRASVL